MPLTIIRQDQELTHVALSGQLDALKAVELEADFHQAVDEHHRSTIVDLSAVSFIMSSGLNILTRAAANLKHEGKKLVLLAPTELVKKAIHNVALDKLTPIAETLEEALALLQE